MADSIGHHSGKLCLTSLNSPRLCFEAHYVNAQYLSSSQTLEWCALMDTFKKANVLVTHEDIIITTGISAMLNAEPGISALSSAETLSGGQVSDPKYDIVVTDYNEGLALACRYRGQTKIPKAAPRILIVTTCDREREVHAALNVGVQGYLLQRCSREELLAAVDALYHGTTFISHAVLQNVVFGLSRESLTPREIGVLELVVKGARNRSIAAALGITINTTKAHVKSILEKLDAQSRTEAAAIATKRGLICASIITGTSLEN